MPPSAFRIELAAASRLAAPVVASQIGIMLMGVIDTMMLGHLSAGALAAGGLGHIVTTTFLLFGYGLLSALDPLIAQAHGAGDSRAIAGDLQRGAVLALAVTLPLVLLMLDVEPFLRAIGQPPEVSVAAADYTRGILWGILPYLLFVVLRQTLQAMSVVRQAAVAIVLGNVVNLLFNWVLIFGHLGMPALGVRGSALSTSIARWVMFLYLLIASRRALARFWSGWRPFAAEVRALRKYLLMLRIGLPIAVHNTLELGIFALAALLIGRIGVDDLGGHQIAINLASLSFMVPLGISGAASTRVGNAIGRGDLPAARRAAAACLLLGGGAMLGFAFLFAAFPGALGRLYTHDPGVLAVVMALLPIAAMFQVFDGLQVVSAGVLRSAADTTVPAVMILLGYWALALPVGWYLAFRAGLGARGLWWGFVVGLMAVAILLLLRIAFRFRSPVARVGAAGA
jgi:MATE family multidrug resistance protein